MVVKGNRLVLKILYPENVTQSYLDWMRDEDIIQFMECREKTYELEDFKDYAKRVAESHNDFLFGIYTSSDNVHIGNIKIGEINQLHKFGNLGLMIGEKKYWGKGYGTEAVKLATENAFHKLHLNKLIAGIYGNNTGCYKAFLKAGYNKVGRLEKHRLHKAKYVDQIIMEKLNVR